MAKQTDGIFVCKKCGCVEFYLFKDGRKRCANCQKERMRKYYATDEYKQKHREYDRTHHRMRRYRCTDEEYEELFRRQNGKCAICGMEVEKLVIDHDHKTGKIRGLLCDSCNWGLGHFKDNPEYLRNAIDYLT